VGLSIRTTAIVQLMLKAFSENWRDGFFNAATSLAWHLGCTAFASPRLRHAVGLAGMRSTIIHDWQF
jgi:hypothetical protein